MMGATALALFKGRNELGDAHLTAIAIGFVVSFLVALVVIRWFVGFVGKHGFGPFAWYRIVAGTVALIALSLR
jgi:undecaprenyl-diphosphatase